MCPYVYIHTYIQTKNVGFVSQNTASLINKSATCFGYCS